MSQYDHAASQTAVTTGYIKRSCEIILSYPTQGNGSLEYSGQSDYHLFGVGGVKWGRKVH